MEFCSLGSSSWFEEKRASCCLEKEELKFSQKVGLSHGPWLGLMESGCEGVKGTFDVGNSLIVLPEVCTELVVDINSIFWPSGGGDCAGARAGGVKV